MRKYGRRVNEEVRGKQTDFEVADISTIAPGRDLRWTQPNDLRRIALTRITSIETLGVSYKDCEVNAKIFVF